MRIDFVGDGNLWANFNCEHGDGKANTGLINSWKFLITYLLIIFLILNLTQTLVVNPVDKYVMTKIIITIMGSDNLHCARYSCGVFSGYLIKFRGERAIIKHTIIDELKRKTTICIVMGAGGV